MLTDLKVLLRILFSHIVCNRSCEMMFFYSTSSLVILSLKCKINGPFSIKIIHKEAFRDSQFLIIAKFSIIHYTLHIQILQNGIPVAASPFKSYGCLVITVFTMCKVDYNYDIDIGICLNIS